MQTATHDVEVTVPVIYQFNELGAVGLRIEWAQDEVAESRMITVAGFEDGLYRHLELFDATDLDAALARYEEIVGAAAAKGSG